MHSRHWCQFGLDVTVKGPDGQHRVSVDRPYCRLGNHPRADVMLDRFEPGSGMYLHATAAGVFCLGVAGTESNDPPARGWIPPGKRIVYGGYKISANLVGVDLPDITSPPHADMDEKGTAAEPFPVIAICFRDNEIARRKLRRQITVVGRTRPSNIPIDSKFLSTSHVAMYWDGGTLWAIDLLSQHGIFLGDQQVDCMDIALGRCVSVGHMKLTFVSYASSREDLPSGDGEEVDLGFDISDANMVES